MRRRVRILYPCARKLSHNRNEAHLEQRYRLKSVHLPKSFKQCQRHHRVMPAQSKARVQLAASQFKRSTVNEKSLKNRSQRKQNGHHFSGETSCRVPGTGQLFSALPRPENTSDAYPASQDWSPSRERAPTKKAINKSAGWQASPLKKSRNSKTVRSNKKLW